jgi:hypothetical protein
VVIAVLNTVRIGTLSLVVGDRPVFDLLHVYVWPAILIVVAVAYVFAWMRQQGGSAGRAARESCNAWHGPARRFLLLTVVGVAAYFAAAGWFYESDLVRTLGGWVATIGGGILAAIGVSATVSGNVVRTATLPCLVHQVAGVPPADARRDPRPPATDRRRGPNIEAPPRRGPQRSGFARRPTRS